MATLAMSGQYALVAVGWVRFNTLRAVSGVVTIVTAANGAPIMEAPTAYMTSGHMTRLVHDSGKRTSMAVIAPTIIAGVTHAWKIELTFDDIADRKDIGLSAKDKASLLRTFAVLSEVAA